MYSLDYFLEMAEFMNEKQYFTATERKEFLKVYRSLFATARPLIGEKEFFFLRQHITEAVLSGSYLRDSNGINRLYHDIATALILSQEVGLDRSTLAAVLTISSSKTGCLSRLSKIYSVPIASKSYGGSSKPTAYMPSKKPSKAITFATYCSHSLKT